MANQICFEQARRGENALYMTLLAESFSSMFSHMQGFSFFQPERIPDQIYYASAYAIVRDDGLEALVRTIMIEMRRRKPTFVVIDGLFAARDSLNGPGALNAFRVFVHELAQQATMMDATILILTNQSRASSSPEYTMVDGWIEMQDEVRDERALRSIIVHKQRGGPMLLGRHEYRIGESGVMVFPRLEARASRHPVHGSNTGRVGTGIRALDTMLGGGIPEQSSSVLLGPTGSGKTTVSMQVLGQCTERDRGLYFGFYETPERLRGKAASVGVDLDRLVEAGVVELVWQPPLENLLDDLGQRIIAAVQRTGARRVVIDGINALKRSSAFSSRTHSFLRALNDILKEQGATTLYTREVPQLFFPEALDVEELAGTVDNTILLHYALDGNAVRRRISIIKVRDSDFDHISQEFEITAQGLEFRRPEGERRLADTTISAMVPNRPGPSAGKGRIR